VPPASALVAEPAQLAQVSQQQVAAAQAPAPSVPARGLSSDVLEAVLGAAQMQLQRCYEQAMIAALTEGEPALPALAFEVAFDITPQGRVERAQITAAKGQAPASLRACLQSAIDGLRFPEAGAPSHARFPVIFQPAVVGP